MRTLYNLEATGWQISTGRPAGFTIGLPNTWDHWSPKEFWETMGWSVEHAQKILEDNGVPTRTLTWTVWCIDVDEI